MAKRKRKGDMTVTEFMVGRYGYDDFSKFLIILGMVILVLSVLAQTTIIVLWAASKYIYLLALLVLGFGYYRMGSKKIMKRKRENEKYLAFMAKFSKKARAKIEREERGRKYSTFELTKELGEDGESVYACYTCRRCGKELRFEEGLGVIKIECPECGNFLVDRT